MRARVSVAAKAEIYSEKDMCRLCFCIIIYKDYRDCQGLNLMVFVSKYPYTVQIFTIYDICCRSGLSPLKSPSSLTSLGAANQF